MCSNKQYIKTWTTYNCNCKNRDLFWEIHIRVIDNNVQVSNTNLTSKPEKHYTMATIFMSLTVIKKQARIQNTFSDSKSLEVMFL